MLFRSEGAAWELPKHFTAGSLDVFREEILSLARGETLVHLDVPAVNAQGELRHLDLTLCLLPCCEQSWSRAVVSFNDVTEGRRAQEALRTSLREKEALLKEVHHRVKNNLQVVTSLLRLEAGRSTVPGTKEVLREMQGRIRSMALLHETLYRSGNLAHVDLAHYLKQLATQLFRAHNADPGAILLQSALTSVRLEMDQAIPCGLIVNELISNCLKHAFPHHHGGEVRLELDVLAGGSQVRLHVGDNGVGLPAEFDPSCATTLGLQLVSDLTRQLQGTLEIRPPGPGAGFTVTFAVVSPHLAPTVAAAKFPAEAQSAPASLSPAPLSQPPARP